ncbi:uncharacterized protein HaLaN_10579 [Haematococcus lacustris]|uniref:MFS domain-containing protein n=1 Tax=Haematococcus lacustris TaxID=44745 RepID=A0A699YY08_HAELA|nr:uncharacterized protein HaLaN_10579 [Haematococcus lacustris]
MQRIGESRWRPLELCWWPDQAALPAKGKEYPGLGYKRSIVGPTATILAEQTHSTEADLAPMLGMGGICTLLTGLPSGWIFDFMPRQGNRLVAATLLVEAAAYTLMTLCTSVLELTVVYAVIGLVFNVVSTGLNVMVIWEFTTHAPQHLPLVLNLLSASFGLGGIIAPQLGWVAAEERWGVLLPALLVLFANVSIELGYAGELLR